MSEPAMLSLFSRVNTELTKRNVIQEELVERFIDEQSKAMGGANVTSEIPLTTADHHLGNQGGVE